MIKSKIKKEFFQKLEAELPEVKGISPVKKVTPARKPLFFSLLGASVGALATAAIVLTVVNFNKGGTIPGTNSNSHAIDPFRYKTDYTPTFDSFAEVAYFSYSQVENQHASNTLNKLEKPIQKLRTIDDDYEDEDGRYHYAIPIKNEYIFSDFLFFEFEAEDMKAFEGKIGHGRIEALAVQSDIFDEKMLILKNGSNYYSCLINGDGIDGMEFSSHKFLEGFELIKDLSDFHTIVLKHNTPYDFTSLYAIEVNEEVTYTPIPGTVHYYDISVSCSVAALRDYFGLEPDDRFSDEDRSDKTVYYSTTEEEYSFELSEFYYQFDIFNHYEYYGVYYHGYKLLPFIPKYLYASDVNGDTYRDLVCEMDFETEEGEVEHTLICYDVHHMKEMFRKTDEDLGGKYSYHVQFIKTRLEVMLTEKGSDYFLNELDRAVMHYTDEDGLTFTWLNYHEINRLKLNGIFDTDGITPVEKETVEELDYYEFDENKDYIVEIEFVRNESSTKTNWPDFKNAVYCEYVMMDSIHISTNNLEKWEFISQEDGVLRYKIRFNEKEDNLFTVFMNNNEFSFRSKMVEETPPELEA